MRQAMFTGIVTAIGRLEEQTPIEGGLRFVISSDYDVATIDIGASIAHDGVCLTVTDKGRDKKNWYEVELWDETIRSTVLELYMDGRNINLERALKIGDELGGHLVSGHIDGIAEIIKIEEIGASKRFTIKPVHTPLMRFIAEKGSVALNGVSLTVNNVWSDRFEVLIIGHTLEVTNWGERRGGDLVNLEIDQMARYAARLSEFAGD